MNGCGDAAGGATTPTRPRPPGRDEIAVLCDLLCDDIRRDLLDAIAAADPGLPVYVC